MSGRRRNAKQPSRTRIPTAILAAYRAATYWVEAPSGRIALRDSVHSPELDRLLAQHAADAWALITAWNPRSEQLAADANARRQRALEKYAAERGYLVIRGVGVPDTGSWTPEKSCLLLGITETAARRLGASAGQYAILAGRKGNKAKILSCVSASVSPEPTADFLQREAALRSPLAAKVEQAIREEEEAPGDLETSLGHLLETGAWLPARDAPPGFSPQEAHHIEDLVSPARLARLENGAAPTPHELASRRQRSQKRSFDTTDSHNEDEPAMYSLHRLLDENGDAYVALVLTYGGASSGIQRSLVNIFHSADEAKTYMTERGAIRAE